MVLVLAITSFLGTLCLLYISAHGNATSEGYLKNQYSRLIRHEESVSLELETEIAKIKDGTALAQDAERLNLVFTLQGIHYFSTPQKDK